MKFFSFWRSLASFRVRIALNLKSLPAEVVFVDLDANAHRAEEYRNAMTRRWRCRRWSLDDGTVLFQSLAILEHLEENASHAAAAAVRSARPRQGARAVADGRLRRPSAAGAARAEVSRPRIEFSGYSACGMAAALARRDAGVLEGHLAGNKDNGRFCDGDAPTIADIWMVGHVTAAITQQIDLATYPTVKRIYETAMALPEFAKAHPLAQPDMGRRRRSKLAFREAIHLHWADGPMLSSSAGLTRRSIFKKVLAKIGRCSDPVRA